MNSQRPSFFKIIGIITITLSIPVGVYLASKAVSYFSRASGTQANLVIDIGSSYAAKPDTWRNLAQGGEERARMLLPVIEKVRPLRPEYIRIDHVFDAYDVVSGSGAGISFNWSKLDETIADIKSMGATPFISLSYMPPSISKTGATEDVPTSWSDWETVVQRTIEHISGACCSAVSGKGGLGIPNVYYEVWNEPDLFGKFKVGGDKSYMDLYFHSATGAGRASNVLPFKFGGPATTALYESWFRALMRAKEGGTRVDFLSWHRYSKNLDDFEKDIVSANTWGADYGTFPSVELLITEIGPNSENDKVYDEGFAAIHTLATAVVMQQDVDRIFNFEIKDGPGPSQYWSRWGMFTHEKFGDPVAKPRTQAFNFLNRVAGGGKVNVAGEGTWVKAFAKEIEGKIKIMVVNYDPNGKHTEAVPMRFVNLRNPNLAGEYYFDISRTDFSGRTKSQSVATTSAEWATLELFEPNTAALFELTPK